MKKSYRRRRWRKVQLARCPVAPEHIYDREQTDKLEHEVEFVARRVSVCRCCCSRLEEGGQAYFVPGTGLARHVQCAPSEGYLDAYAEWKSDEKAKSPRGRAERLAKEVVELLSREENEDLRRDVLLALFRVPQKMKPAPKAVLDPETVAAGGHLRLVSGGECS